jgi:hypothetical protein
MEMYTNSIGDGTGTGEYYVYARELSPYWQVAGSGFYDSSQFPEYYDPSNFYAANFSIQTTPNDEYSVNLQWQDDCNYEDGYKVYIKTDSMSVPSLVATLPANSTTCPITLPEEALNCGYYAWSVPTKNGINGSAYNPLFTDPIYYVEFYDGYNYNGPRFKLSGSELYINHFGDYIVGNDDVSSIKINGPFEVTVYKDTNFGGGSHIYRFSDPNLSDETFAGGTSVNNNISSAVIRRISKAEMNGIYLFEHANYGGKWTKITSDTPTLTGTVVGNDRTSSVKIYGDQEFTLYIHSNYGGTKHQANSDIPHMYTTPIGNDELTSIRIGYH